MSPETLAMLRAYDMLLPHKFDLLSSAYKKHTDTMEEKASVPTVSFKDKKLKSVKENSTTLLTFFINGEYVRLGGTKYDIQLTCDSKSVTFSTTSWSEMEEGFTIKTKITTKEPEVINIAFKFDGKESNSLNLVVAENKDVESKKQEKCLCKKSRWSAEDLKQIVTKVRKLESMGEVQYRDEKTNYKKWVDEKGNIVVSKNKKKGYKPYTYSISIFDYPTGELGNKTFKDRIFFSDVSEKLEDSERTYDEFAKQLNAVFKNYEINNCLRKIHFLTQIYHETERFTKTYESRTDSGYSGGDAYVGRGLIHITNDFNYLRYYDHVNFSSYFALYKKYRLKVPKNSPEETVDNFNIRTENKHISEEIMEDVNKLSKLVASKMKNACDAAGWYWKHNDNNIDINALADKDDILRVSAAVNHPSVALSKHLKAGDVGGYTDRKKYYDLFLKVFDYENCK